MSSKKKKSNEDCTIHMVYRQVSETGMEKIDTISFENRDELIAKISEIEAKNGMESDSSDEIIGIFEGKKISYQATVKVEVTLD